MKKPYYFGKKLLYLRKEMWYLIHDDKSLTWLIKYSSEHNEQVNFLFLKR